MSQFDELFATIALPSLMEQIGDRAVAAYTPRGGGQAVSWDGVLGPESSELQTSEEGQVLIRRRHLIVPKAADGTFQGVVSPALGATVEADGRVYAIEKVDFRTPGHCRLALVHRGTAEKMRHDLKRA